VRDGGVRTNLNADLTVKRCPVMCQDGDTRSLRLALTDVHGTTLTGDSWIQLNASSQTVYGLSLDVHAGFHQFQLAAFNRNNNNVSTPLEVFAFYFIIVIIIIVCLL